jgi:hypothetical protein
MIGPADANTPLFSDRSEIVANDRPRRHFPAPLRIPLLKESFAPLEAFADATRPAVNCAAGPEFA